jgi:hypothetical protein
MTVKLQKRISPILNSTNNKYLNNNTINFKNGIDPGSIVSTSFVVTYNSNSVNTYINDVPNDAIPNKKGTGKLQLISLTTGEIINSSYGVVNYGTGVVSIDNLEIIGYPADTSDIRISAIVQDEYLDIAVSRNQIILLDDSKLSVDANRFSGLTVNVITV